MRREVGLLLLGGVPLLGGCAGGQLFGGMAQNFEYQKLVEVHAAYDGLQNTRVAVLVDADLAILYEHPSVAVNVGVNVSSEIARNVEGITVLPSGAIAQWQFRTPQWNAMPYGEIAEALDVDRVVHVDIYEYRLHPRGNRWLWEGVCSAHVGVIERDGIDPDSYVDVFDIDATFPDIKGVGRDAANSAQIQTGLLVRFVQKTAKLFYRHLDPKYPDKYKLPLGGERRTLEDLDKD